MDHLDIIVDSTNIFESFGSKITKKKLDQVCQLDA